MVWSQPRICVPGDERQRRELGDVGSDLIGPSPGELPHHVFQRRTIETEKKPSHHRPMPEALEQGDEGRPIDSEQIAQKCLVWLVPCIELSRAAWPGRLAIVRPVRPVRRMRLVRYA